MGLKLKREKERIFILSFIYKLSKMLFFLNSKRRFNFYLTLEWIFDRLAHEESFKHFSFEEHPLRYYSITFLKQRIKATDKVLDLGCNFGEISNKIAEFAQKVVGVDIIADNIEVAKSRYKKANLEFVHGDAFEFLKNSKDKFDVIILSHIIEHIDEPISFLKECALHCSNLYIEVPDYDKSYLNHYRTKMNNPLQYTDADHVWEFDRIELHQIIKDAGWNVVEAEYRFGVIKFWCEADLISSL